jgi:hypothetical protein
MTRDAREIAKAFDLIGTACQEIKDHDRCEDCPLRHLCIDEEVCAEFIDLVSASTWDEFIDFANNVEFTDADLDAQNADFLRKFELEERMIDEEYE